MYQDKATQALQAVHHTVTHSLTHSLTSQLRGFGQKDFQRMKDFCWTRTKYDDDDYNNNDDNDN